MCPAGAIRRLLRTEWLLAPEAINAGFCDAFAESVCALVPGAVVDGQPMSRRSRRWEHAWVRFAGRCYDAETPEGVVTPDELPFYRRRRQRGVHLAESVAPDAPAGRASARGRIRRA
jgi:hypothetical protein